MGFLDFIHFASRQGITTFIFGVPSVSLEPLPFHAVKMGGRIEFPPKVCIFNGFAGTRDPTFHAPGVNPLRDAFSEILRVRVNENLAGLREQLKSSDGGP